MLIGQIGLPGSVPPTEVTVAEFVALFVATYSVAAYRPVRVLAAGLGAVAVALALAAWRFDDVESLQGAVPVLGVHLLVSLAGRRVRLREAQVDRLELEAEERDRLRLRLQEEAVREERVRIARELHDLIAHSVSVMVVHAGAGQRQFARDPEQAVAALRTVETVGRGAMTELQSLLEILRREGAPVEAAVSLDHLDVVAAPLREAGVDVELDLPDPWPELSTGATLCAYRLVQEALTNVLRHSGAKRTRVTMRDDRGVLDLSVTDDGRGSGHRDLSLLHGHGLRGMAERVRLVAGEFEASDLPSGGFRVHARIPIGAS
jgi:signal transduction histidine kinase